MPLCFTSRTIRDGTCRNASESVLTDKKGTTLVICGDTPLIKAETMRALITLHEETGSKATV